MTNIVRFDSKGVTARERCASLGLCRFLQDSQLDYCNCRLQSRLARCVVTTYSAATRCTHIPQYNLGLFIIVVYIPTFYYSYCTIYSCSSELTPYQCGRIHAYHCNLPISVVCSPIFILSIGRRAVSLPGCFDFIKSFNPSRSI